MQKFKPIFTEDKPSGAEDIVVIDLNSEHFGLVEMNIFLDIDYPGIDVVVKKLKRQDVPSYIEYPQPDIIEVGDIQPTQEMTNDALVINDYMDWRRLRIKYKGEF